MLPRRFKAERLPPDAAVGHVARTRRGIVLRLNDRKKSMDKNVKERTLTDVVWRDFSPRQPRLDEGKRGAGGPGGGSQHISQGGFPNKYSRTKEDFIRVLARHLQRGA